MLIDGKAIAEDIYSELEKRSRAKLTLGIVVASHDPVIESFVKIKSRAAARLHIELRRVDLLHEPTTADALAAIEKLAPDVDGIIVQLPLPDALDTEVILAAIPPYLDVDAINPAVGENERPVFAPVAEAIEEILRRSNVELQGKKIAIIGAGRLVGAPVAEWFKRKGISVLALPNYPALLNATNPAVGSILGLCDIIISGTGNPGLIKPHMIKEGVVLIDAGTSESSGKVVGDADPSCASKCSIFTPVPGGVGPIAVAMIFKNLFELSRKL